MANDGTVKIGTELDNTGFKSGMNGLGSFASKGFSAVGGAAKAMAGITISALAGVAAGMGAAVVSGVKYNAAMEMYTANFKTMLGSEEAAVAKVNELKKLGAATPFEMADLATATTTLLAFGVDASKSTEILTMLGDVSLGNVDKLDRLSNSFGKVQSQGKLTGETCQMMIEAGFNPLKVISETTGESMSDLATRMSKGAISADEVTAAFKKATSEGGQFYKGMETASVTFDGLVSTLKDNANSLVGEVVKPISDSMTKSLLPSAIGMIQELTDAFAKDGIPGLINAAGDVVGKIISGIASQAPKVIEMASGFLTTLLNALMVQLPALSAAGIGIIMELAEAILVNLPLLFELGITLLTNLIVGIAAALPGLIPLWQQAVMTILQTIMDNLPLILTAAIQIVLALITGMIAMLPTLIAMIPTLIMTIVNVLLANLPAIIMAAVQILIALIQGIAQAIPLLTNMIPQIITSIVKTLIANLPLLLQAAVQIIMAIITGLIQAIPALIGMIPQIIMSIVNALKSFDWGKVGKGMLDGIKDGFLSAAGGLLTAAKNAISSAINGVKNFLGIHSPSKLLRDLIGKNMVMGISVGVEKNAGTLEDTAIDTTKRAVSAMQNVSSADAVGQMRQQAVWRGRSIAGNAVEAIKKTDSAESYNKSLAKEIAKALHGAKVEMEGQTVGRLIAPYVDEEFGSTANLKARFAT